MKTPVKQSSSVGLEATAASPAVTALHHLADPLQRQHMIEEAAYYIAEHRGFIEGDPVRDWLEAESEIDALLALDQPDLGAERAALAELREAFGNTLAHIHDAIDANVLREAFGHALADVRKLGKYPDEIIRKAALVMRSELTTAADRMGESWESFSLQRAGLFLVWRDRSKDFLRRSAVAVREWLHHDRHAGHH